MAQKPIYGYAILDDNTRWDDVLVTLRTRFAWEKAAKANGWNSDDNPFTAGAFLSWHAARQAGLHSLDWETFVERTIDANVTHERLTTTSDDEEDPEGPTQTAGSAQPSP